MYGKQTAVTAQQAYESSRRNGGAANVLTQEQFTKAFNTGRSSKDARIQNSAARQRGEGKVYFGQDVDYGGERYKAASEDMVSSAELDVIKTLAKVTGTDVVFYQSEADMSGRYKGANGFMRNGTMYLDVNAGANRTSEESAVLLTAAHELTHYIRENNAEGYAQLRDFVTRHLIEDGADIEALAEQKAARENGLLSMDEAVEEVIADSCEMMLEDTQLPEIMAKENPGLYEQIREWIANFAEKLRKAFTGVEARHAEAKAMMKYADELSRIWDSALAGAVRNTETASGNARQSIREIGDTGKYYVKADRQVLFGNDPEAWGEQLTRYINKEIRNGRDVLLTAADGEVIKLTATTAEKGAFRNVWYDAKGAAHLLSDAEYETKLNAEAHIDEIVKTSEDRHKGRPNTPDENNLHGDMAKDGWRYRRAYFMDHDGKYYDLTLSVAYGRDGKVAYNIANMRERSFPTLPGSSNPKTGAQRGKASLRGTIPQPGTESNAGFSTFVHQNRVFFVFSQRKPTSNKTRRPQGLRVISSYSSCFHIVALITRLTDREALAGKYAVFAHIIKQLVTAYAAVYEAYSVVLLCKLPHGVLAVYVIHSYSGMRCNIPIYKALQHLCFKSVNKKAAASRSAHIIHFSAAASRKLRFQSAQQIIDIRIEEHTVYRLKVHALVMYVYKLSQSILCFRGAYERCRSLCRGERMVAVSHGKKHPLPLFPAFLRKRRESGEYAPLLILGNEPAAKVPAAEHKVKIIELRELRRVYAFYYLPALIVHEDHDMRQLQRSIPADIDARRYAREHRPLRGADEAFCPGLIAVILQRKCADDAAASPS